MYDDTEKRLQGIFSGMKQRCYGKNLDKYVARSYRDKGIRICDEWLNNPSEFVRWSLEHGYKKGLSIDRIDPDGNYEPSNCQWLTVSENAKKAAEDNRKRKALRAAEEEKRRKEYEAFVDGVRRAGSLDRYFWLEMYDELSEKDRSSIEFAVSILKLMREHDKSAKMVDAFARSAELISRYMEAKSNMKNAEDEVGFAFRFASDFIKTLIQEEPNEKTD